MDNVLLFRMKILTKCLIPHRVETYSYIVSYRLRKLRGTISDCNEDLPNLSPLFVKH